MSTNLKRNLNAISVDSFKYFIELEEVDVIDQTLLDTFTIIKLNDRTQDFESISNFKRDSKKVQEQAYRVHYSICNYFGVEHVVIGINSNFLETEYFEGISKKNIKKIYNKLVSQNIISFKSFEHFLTGKVSDIDFKLDFEVENVEHFQELTKYLFHQTKPTTKKDSGANRFSTENNLGIEWNEREKSTWSNPFLKIYFKQTEALRPEKSDFFETYNLIPSTINRARIETTMRRKRDIVKCGFKSNVLLDVLSASKEIYNTIISNSLSNLLEPQKKPTMKRNETMSPSDYYIFDLVKLRIDHFGMTFESALNNILENANFKPVTQSRQKKKITEIYNVYVMNETSTKETTNRRVNDFFKTINFG